jgi:pantetheine-phosphate adenylyltransferase
MKRTALFPGSFDPITLGHESLVRRALPLFDEVVIAIGINSEKKYMFSMEQRISWIEKVFSDEPRVRVATYDGLTINFCKKIGARFILRGLRTGVDFEFERGIAQVNMKLAENIETVFLLTEANLTPITSSIVREVIRHGGNISGLVPEAVKIR